MMLRNRNWTPTKEQAKLMEVALEAGLRCSLSAICKKASVSRRTFYNWLRDDLMFREAWNRLYQDAVSQHLPGVIAAMVFQAQRGNVSASRLIAEIAGVMRTRMEVSGVDGQPIEIGGARERLVGKLADLAARTAAGQAARKSKR